MCFEQIVIAIFEKKVWWLTSSLMASLWELCNEGCGVLVLWRFVTFAGRTRDTNLEVSAVWGCQMRLVFFCMSTEFQPHVFETNRKQTTNLYKPVFDVFWADGSFSAEIAAESFFLQWNVRRHSQRDACASAHFSSQGSTRAKLGSNKSQSKGQETSSDFVVSFGSLEQKLELERDGLCVWVEGFF